VIEKTFSIRDNPGGLLWHIQPYDGLTKTAQLEISDKLHPRIQDFVRAFKPTRNGVYVLVNALGASEYWGSNANGDAFPEKALIHAPSDWDELSPEEMARVGKTWEYGFPTFMNAHVFTHHQNKDPAKSIGDVVLAVWNPKMHRVELILYIDRSRCMAQDALHVIERLERGEYPDVSMGCKVPFDVCTICGNQSKTRADYCPCCTRSPGLNKILPDGRKVAVVNTRPRFFDLSVVFIGADKTAKVMAKLAEVGNQNCLGACCYVKTAAPKKKQKRSALADDYPNDFTSQYGQEKAAAKCPCEKLNCSTCCVASMEKYAERIFGVKHAAHRKLSEIIKDIPAGPFSKRDLPKLEQGDRDIPNDVLDLMGGMDPSRSLSTLGMMGIVPKPREFQRIMLIHVGKKPLAEELDRKGETFDPDKAGAEDVIPTGRDLVDDRLQELLSLIGMMRDRSVATPAIHRRLTISVHGGPRHASRRPSSQGEGERPVLKKLAALYNGYRQALLTKAAEISNHVASSPQLRADLFDSSMAQAFAGGTVKTASASVLGPESLAYLMGAHYHNRDYHTNKDTVLGSLALSGIAAEDAA
jgi:hypothetical protein